MRMRRRRKGARVAWFPNLSQEPSLPETCGQDFPATKWPVWLNGDFTVDSGDCPCENTQVADLTWDFPAEEEVLLNQVPSLADFQGSAWRLRRCVGNLFVHVTDASASPSFATSFSKVIIGAGLMVLRTDETGNPLSVDSEYSPLAQKNIRDPWIWRRTWILQPLAGRLNDVSLSFISNIGPPGAYPASNVMYGTAVGGPSMDAKTNRRIGLEERLFLCIDGQYVNYPGTNPVLVNWHFDYRLLGSLMRETNRRNASR